MSYQASTAIADALSLLKSGNVNAATARIQQSLGIPADARQRPVAKAGAASQPSPGKPVLGLKGVFPKPSTSRSGRTDSEEHPAFAAGLSGLTRREPLAGTDPRFTAGRFQSASGSLDYKLYVPADHARRELGLVMMLHGCTQDPDDFARGTQMNNLADEFGLIVVYPHQPRTANAQGCWNWFEARQQRRGSGEPATLSALAQSIAASYAISRDRTFVAGLSAGGAMADVLATTYPDIFAAAGIHSGLPHGAACDLMSALGAMAGKPPKGKQMSDSYRVEAGPPIRKIIFHGAADGTVKASSGLQIFRRMSADRKDTCELSTDGQINGRRVTRTRLDGPSGESLAEHWLIHGTGHAWCGGDPAGSYAAADGPDASREMVRFFLQKQALGSKS